MDRCIEELKSEKFYSKNCVHTKHLYSLLDWPNKDESSEKILTHLEKCTICSKEFNQIKLKSMASLAYIPKVQMDKDLRQSFDNEVAHLFKVMDLNDREFLKSNIKNGFIVIDKMGIEFIKNLLSKKMFKAYFMGMVIFVALKIFL